MRALTGAAWSLVLEGACTSPFLRCEHGLGVMRGAVPAPAGPRPAAASHASWSAPPFLPSWTSGPELS